MDDYQPTEGAEWRIVMPSEALAWLSDVTLPWWVAGGWALDLFLGRQTREHRDLDIGILRRDAVQFLEILHFWEVFDAKDGALSRLGEGLAPRAEVNSLWCRPIGTSRWAMEVLLDASDQDFWVFRRHAQVRRPFAEVVRRDLQGVPYLAPEVQLLYKARSMRPCDEADFARVAPQLDTAARTWLRKSLLRTDPGHPWTSALGDS